MDKSVLMNLKKPFGITNLEIVRKKLPAGHAVGVHWHNYCEIEILMSGRAEHCLNGQKYEVSRGSMYLLSLYDYHALQTTEPSEIININFMPEILDTRISKFLDNSGKTIMCTFDDDELKYIDNRIGQLEKENASCLNSEDFVISSILSEILALALRKSDNTSDEMISPLVQKATAYIHANFRNDISLGSIADALGVSSGYLGRLLKASLDKSFNEYLGSVRLKYACNLLESTVLPINEIALSSGHNSVQYFLHVFKRKFGMTPSEFRECSASSKL